MAQATTLMTQTTTPTALAGVGPDAPEARTTHQGLNDTDRIPAPGTPMTLITLCLAVLIAQIDTAVVNLGIQPIKAHFHTGITPMQWVMDSYNLVYAALLLSGGLVADLWGRKRAYVTGVILFAGASLACALAPNVGTLIAGRAGAGMGAALLTPATLAILRVAWPDAAQRSRALGIWAACNGAAFAIAPTLGGLLISWFGWRSLFFLGIPVCLLALALARKSITESADPAGRHVDQAGQTLGALALGGLTLAAIESHQHGALSLGALVVGLAALILFLRTESRLGASAMVPLDLFRAPALRGAIIAAAGMTSGMYGILFLQPLVWQELGTLTATQAGMALMPMALVFLVVSPLTGRLSQWIGARLLACGGVLIIGIGLLTVGWGAGHATIALSEAGLILAGLGMGFATGPMMGLAVGTVSAARSGTASALINVARMAGAALGVAVLGVLYAIMREPVAGLRLAALCGGAFQIICAIAAWRTTRNDASRSGS
jgi:EmrB/QacA subfamily drug resistance transporter